MEITELSSVLIQPTKVAPETGLAAKVAPLASTVTESPETIVVPATLTVPNSLWLTLTIDALATSSFTLSRLTEPDLGVDKMPDLGTFIYIFTEAPAASSALYVPLAEALLPATVKESYVPVAA